MRFSLSWALWDLERYESDWEITNDIIVSSADTHCWPISSEIGLSATTTSLTSHWIQWIQWITQKTIMSIQKYSLYLFQWYLLFQYFTPYSPRLWAGRAWAWGGLWQSQWCWPRAWPACCSCSVGHRTASWRQGFPHPQGAGGTGLPLELYFI